MSWRDRAAQIIAEAPMYEPTKPTKDLPPTPFAGFVSAPLGASGNFLSTGDVELDTLIHRVADFYECPPDERRLMIETARDNSEDALECFRAMAALQQAANGDALPDSAMEARRQRVLELLAAQPDARYALFTDLKTDPETVLLTLAIRGRATCELRIPREKYDPFLLLALIDRHSETVH